MDENKNELTEDTEAADNADADISETETNEDTAVKAVKTVGKSGNAPDKKMMAIIAGMGAVIIGLIIALLCVIFSGKAGDTTASENGGDSSSQSETSSESANSDSSFEDSQSGDSSAEENSQPESSDTDNSDTESEIVSDGFTLTYSTDNSWENTDAVMYGVQLMITNGSGSAIDSWSLEMNIDGLVSADGWNGSFDMDGSKLTVTNAEYNGSIAAGGSIVIGCNLGVQSTLKITSATLNGNACTVKAGHVDQNGNNNNNNNGDNNNNGNNNGQGEIDIDALLERSKDAVQGDDWLHTDGKRILDKDGKQVWLTGVNWFGYNTGTNLFDGLWNSQLEPTVKAIADHGFNLIRVPISAELLNQWASGEYPKANYNNAYNTTLNSMNSLEIFDYFLKLAEASGLKVMPDIHSAETNASGHNVNLWYTDRISADDYYHALEWLADRYKDNDTIIALDLKNEPHGKPFEGDGAAIWNDSTKQNNWKYTAETAAKKVLAKNPNLLIMVEGTEIYPVDISSNSDFHSTDEKDYYFNWWGGNLRAVKDYPIDLGQYQNKLVYSPHDYGPTVYEQPWFKGDYSYDSLMKDCWKDNWLYIQTENIAPLLIGEWGGFMKQPNLKWMTFMRELISNYHLNHTFWCLNANSGDTGGLLLDDFITWDDEKYNFVKEVLWQENGKFVGLDHKIALGDNGITLSDAKGLSS